MSTNSDKAAAMFAEGYNCAQSVVANCGGAAALGREEAVRVAAAFGGGMCHLGQTCGAVTGALMAIGLRTATTDPAGKKKAQHPAQEFVRRFRDLHGQIGCTELLGVDLGVPGGVEQAAQKGLFKSVCAKLVRSAADILDDMFPDDAHA